MKTAIEKKIIEFRRKKREVDICLSELINSAKDLKEYISKTDMPEMKSDAEIEQDYNITLRNNGMSVYEFIGRYLNSNTAISDVSKRKLYYALILLVEDGYRFIYEINSDDILKYRNCGKKTVLIFEELKQKSIEDIN